MNSFDILFCSAMGIMKIFKYGIEPIESEIIELTDEQYEQLRVTQTFDMSSKWYVWLPASSLENSNELCILNEDQKKTLFEAKASIERYMVKSNHSFDHYDQKLYQVAKMYPRIFSEGTKYCPRAISDHG